MLKRQADRLGKWLHWVFEASLLIKGLLASGETISGLGLLLTPNRLIISLLAWMTSNELAQDPSDAMARWFEHVAQSFPIQTQHFYALYLSLHGGLKLIMVIMLAWRVVWAYPAAMAVLAGFVTYQLYEWQIDHPPVLLMLSCFDLVMIVLVWREWRVLRGKPALL